MEFRSHWWTHTSIWEERLPAQPSSPSPSLPALLYFSNDWPESYLLVPMLYLHLTQDVGGVGQSRPSCVFSLLYPQKRLWDPVLMFYIQSLSKHLPNTRVAPWERKECSFATPSFLFLLKTNRFQHPRHLGELQLCELEQWKPVWVKSQLYHLVAVQLWTSWETVVVWEKMVP